MEAKALKKIISEHKKWLKNNESGSRADLTGANLTRANLTRANLTEADLTGANLTRANLTEADLTGANLTRANLTRANLSEANLTWADLTGANLSEANLTRANLTWANLTRANLTRANLTRTNLDFSCLPLWCGGAHFKADRKLVRQLLAHICTIEITDIDDGTKKAIDAIKPEALKSHRARDLGLEPDQIVVEE